MAAPTASARPMSTRQMYAQVRRDEARLAGLCPACGTRCYGDCQA